MASSLLQSYSSHTIARFYSPQSMEETKMTRSASAFVAGTVLLAFTSVFAQAPAPTTPAPSPVPQATAPAPATDAPKGEDKKEMKGKHKKGHGKKRSHDRANDTAAEQGK